MLDVCNISGGIVWMKEGVEQGGREGIRVRGERKREGEQVQNVITCI